MTEENSQHLRWVERLSNYEKALESLTSAIELSQQRPLFDLGNQELMQAFEFTNN